MGGSFVPANTVKVYEAGKQATGKRVVAETVVQAPVDVVRAVVVVMQHHDIRGLGNSGLKAISAWNPPFQPRMCGIIERYWLIHRWLGPALLVQVWRVLTNYERLADFVPNLESCERVPCPRSRKVCACCKPLPGMRWLGWETLRWLEAC